jgi:hypothetical protein
VVNEDRQEPPFEGGSQPVPENRAEMPKGGRSVGQAVIIALGVLVLLAALLWILVPFAG